MSCDCPHLFVFGLGFSGLALGRVLRNAGWRVSGTTRSAKKKTALEAEGFGAHLFDRGKPMRDAPEILASVTHLVASVPPDDRGDPVLGEHGGDMPESLSWIGYLSTTGVYGNTNGAEVDEESPLNPTAMRSKRRVSAERAWLGLFESRGMPVHLFRLAGIYGPGRSAIDTLRAGRARRIDKPGHKFSRIHVDDIAGVLQASMSRPNPGGVYNVCDDEAEGPAEVIRFAAELLGLEPPPLLSFEDAKKTMSPMGLSFWADNRRISNRRLSEELGYRLKFPTYREGLGALAEKE